MIRPWHDRPIPVEARSGASAAPRGFLPVGDGLQQPIDRKLGYFGEGRFVLFYYEPRGEEVVWRDGRSYGFATGGWQAFLDEVEPLAGRFGLRLVNHEGPSREVLLVDRQKRQAYFADRLLAETVVRRQCVPATAS